MDNDYSRREMLWMSALAAAAFTPVGRAVAAATQPTKLVDAGLLSKYGDEGIYPEFQPAGFYMLRRGDRVVAQSSLCTHKGCKLKASSDGFVCPCHGSIFSVDGTVTKGPARRDLPRYAVSLNDDGHVIVDLSRAYQASDFEQSGAYVKAQPRA